jgi:hypothetical protein
MEEKATKKKKRKFYKINVSPTSTISRDCPICKLRHIEDSDTPEETEEMLYCGGCHSTFEYDRDTDQNKDIYRYELLSDS